MLEERQALVSGARAAAQKTLQEAKKAITADMEDARKELEQSSGTLAGEIAETIMAGRTSGPGASEPGRAR